MDSILAYIGLGAGLSRRGQNSASDNPALQLHFERHLRAVDAWIEQQPNIDRLTLAHAEVIADPRRTAERLSEFLRTDLNIERTAGIVDPTLYRQRTA